MSHAIIIRKRIKEGRWTRTRSCIWQRLWRVWIIKIVTSTLPHDQSWLLRTTQKRQIKSHLALQMRQMKWSLSLIAKARKTLLIKRKSNQICKCTRPNWYKSSMMIWIRRRWVVFYRHLRAFIWSIWRADTAIARLTRVTSEQTVKRMETANRLAVPTRRFMALAAANRHKTTKNLQKLFFKEAPIKQKRERSKALPTLTPFPQSTWTSRKKSCRYY